MLMKWKLLSRVQLVVTPWNSPWNSPVQNAGVGSPSPLQGIIPTQGSNRSLLHYRRALHIRWSKYWSFSFRISPSSEYLGLTSFKINWFDLLAVQGTLKSLLQQHSLKASILWCSTFFIAQLSHPYMTTTGTIIAFAIWTFVGKEMSLLLNMLSRLVIAFLLRNKCLLI